MMRVGEVAPLVVAHLEARAVGGEVLMCRPLQVPELNLVPRVLREYRRKAGRLV